MQTLGPIKRVPTLTPGSVEAIMYGFSCILEKHEYDKVAAVVGGWTDEQRDEADHYIAAELYHQMEGTDKPTEPEFIRVARTGA